MEEDSGRQRLIDGGKSFPSSLPQSPPNEYDNALYHEQGRSPRETLIMYFFMLFVIIMVMITIILSLYRASVDSTYILLGVSIISIGMVELVLVRWTRSGELPAEKLWFLYFVGICISLESIFTDVLLYHRPEPST
ncbi:unnamed protein product [Pocillopora meandrina]|uniref:Transmembrane protein n=1 Tax=Pocillopora meandrina TaxID=46732 RepID=A0AAU9XUP6_9CNID|nr:unnamed protein product [Pocillopora meandrina]